MGFDICAALDFLPFRADGGGLTANSCAPGVGGGRKEDDGEGNGDADTSPSRAIDSRDAGDQTSSQYHIWFAKQKDENKKDEFDGLIIFPGNSEHSRYRFDAHIKEVEIERGIQKTLPNPCKQNSESNLNNGDQGFFNVNQKQNKNHPPPPI